MKIRRAGISITISLIFLLSCTNSGEKKITRQLSNRILQQSDGVVSLKLDLAGRYCDKADPSNNTADWNIVISKPGRFKVWLSSCTLDTVDLDYNIPVKVSFLDSHLEADPACDRILPWKSDGVCTGFRAESFMGTVYVQDPGEYNIQVISDKVTPEGQNTEADKFSAKLLSVILTPDGL